MTDSDKKKTCGSCGEEKDISEYAKSARSVDGLNKICRACYKFKYYKKSLNVRPYKCSRSMRTSDEVDAEAGYQRELALRASRKKVVVIKGRFGNGKGSIPTYSTTV